MTRGVSPHRNGFALVNAPTQVHDLYSPDEIKTVYNPKLEHLPHDALGASRVVGFDHDVRRETRRASPPP